MTHEDAGHYAAKHPAGTQADPALCRTIEKKSRRQRISCVAAHAVARDFAVSPATVGRAIDLMEHRLEKCQMGLFGYTPERRIVTPAVSVSPELSEAIEKNSVDDRITCLACWQIAERLELPRMAVSSACEALQLKIITCQLGAFK